MSEMNLLIAMKQMLFYTMAGVGLITIPMLIIGITFSIIQAATQINEMTITFIPKLIVMFTLLFTISPWLMERLVQFTNHLMNHLPMYLR